MTHEKRVCVAAAIALIRNGQTGNVYDYGRGKYVMINPRISGRSISIYDFDRKGYLTGMAPNLYDYPSGAYINVNVNGNQFNGFDYQTGRWFNGSVNGSLVSMFDGDGGQYFNYGV